MPRRSQQPSCLSLAGLRIAVRLMPRRFRAAYGDDMVRLFCDRYPGVAATGALSGARFLLRSVLDVLTAAAAERRHSSFQPTRRRLGAPTPRPGDGSLLSLMYDLRHALRGAAQRPGFTAIVVTTLALGIGANTAIFTVVNGVLLEPLPFDESDRLMRIWGRFDPESGFDFPQMALSEPEYLDYHRQSSAMEDVAAYRSANVTLLAGGAAPERVRGLSVTPNLFSVLRVEAALGRTFTASEGLPGEEETLVLADEFWRSRFGGDPAIVGTTVTVSGSERTIVGVMPPGFGFPRPDIQVYAPYAIDPADPGGRSSHSTAAVARLAPGQTLEQAGAEMSTLMAAWRAEWPDIHTGHYLFIRPLLEDLVGRARPMLLTLLGASGFVLLIVCANVAAIALARGEDRSREIALRTALGASRRRLVQLVLGESLVLAGAGGLLGVGAAMVGVRALLSLDAGSIPRSASVAIQWPVLGFALAITVATTVLFSLAPALHAAGVEPRRNLVEDGSRSSAGGSRLMFRRGLVSVEVALCFVLVFGAGLMIRSFGALTDVDPGYLRRGILVASVSLPASDYPDDAQVIGFFNELTTLAAALPGVESAAIASAVPIYSGNGSWDFQVEGKQELVDSKTAYNAAFRTVGPGYFETMQIGLVGGRFNGQADTVDSELVALVNEEMVRRFFPDDDPLGQRIRIESDPDNPLPWMRIVGVVRDVRDQGLAQPPSPAYYGVAEQTALSSRGAFRFNSLVLRARGDAAALVPAVRDLVSSLDASLPLVAPETIEQTLAGSVAGSRFATLLLSVFAAIALGLGASGIYGVLAYSVAQRTQELGIRKALGAPSDQLVAMVVRQGMVPVVLGLGAGALAAAGLGRLMSSLLFEVSPLDATTYAAVSATLALVAVVACFAPAVRAARLDPLLALRNE